MLLEALADPKAALWVGKFLTQVFCDVEREKLDAFIPAMPVRRPFLELCRGAGCVERSPGQLQPFAGQVTYPSPSPRRCCLLRLRPGAGLSVTFEQLELYVRAKGLRFARPEELLGLARAAPGLRFLNCHALGVPEGVMNSVGRVCCLTDDEGAEGSVRHLYQGLFPQVLHANMTVLAVKID